MWIEVNIFGEETKCKKRDQGYNIPQKIKNCNHNFYILCIFKWIKKSDLLTNA